MGFGAGMFQEVLSLLRPNQGRRQKTLFAGLSSLLTTSATPRQRAEPIGIELRHLIDSLTQSGRELYGVADSTLAGHVKEVLDGMSSLSCRIAVVGQVKAGKSSFINALIQRPDLLPTHVNPWTAVATALHFGMPGKPLTGADFTFFTADEWASLGLKVNGSARPEFDDGFAEMKRRAEVRLGEQFHHLLGKTHFYQSVQPGVLQNYLCAGPPVGEISREIKPGRFADITKTANIYFPPPPLAMPAILIDTPGINDPTHLRHRITRDIVEGADLYIVVITARQALASSDLGLLKLLRGLDKKRIVLFINRIDELQGRSGGVDLVRQHVKQELARVFEDVSIPVIAGSAKWAGLATSDDLDQLRREAATPSFQAFAAEKRIPVPSAHGPETDLGRFQDSFRAASGLNAVAKLLSLFMLSGFVVNHARGVTNVLLSAADMSADNARRELHAIAGHLRDVQATAALGRSTAAGISTCLAEMNACLRAVGEGVQRLKAECGPAARTGIARLETALETDIRALSDQAKPSIEAFYTPAGPSDVASRDELEAEEEIEAADTTAEGLSWLASVKEATFGLLRRAVAETPPPSPEPARKPATARQTSLTVPVTTQKVHSIDAGSSWWSGWTSDKQPGGGEMAEAGEQNDAAAEPRAMDRGAKRNFQEFLEGGAKPNLVSIRPLMQFADRLRTLPTIGGSVAERDLLAAFVGRYEKAVNDACLAIAVHEKVSRQIKALFMPQGGSD